MGHKAKKLVSTQTSNCSTANRVRSGSFTKGNPGAGVQLWTMKVFISWSGPRSKRIAEVLHGWLPSAIQAVRPFYSPDDLAKGSRWSAEVAQELECSSVGILVVTPDNTKAPWLLFEAGALSKNVKNAKVCPLLFCGLTATDIEGPLVQFQCAQFSEEEVSKLMEMINTELGDSAMAPEALRRVKEMWWPELNRQISEIESLEDPVGAAQHRSERDLLEEILELSRRLATRQIGQPRMSVLAFIDLCESVGDLVDIVIPEIDRSNAASLYRLKRSLQYLRARNSYGPRGTEAITRILDRLPDTGELQLLMHEDHMLNDDSV